MDKRRGNKLPDRFKRESSDLRNDSGPYIGRVKNNLDPTRSGRLQVYIPDLVSGEEDNPENWRTVAYASPYLGYTNQPDTNTQNSFKKVRHSYGMWAVAPDIGNLVLCTFVAGDPNRGFWFACIPSQLGHHMLPGMAGSSNVDSSQIEDPKVKANYNNKPTIVAEFNENGDQVDWSNFANAKKPIHEDQYRVLLNQGLEEDYIRGIISSSSNRESPSAVFGISTPGRAHKDPAEDPQYEDKIKSGQLKESDYAVASRKGGHVFVMDDGNYAGKDRLVRLRTAAGHQILMNDTEDILYIGNDTGSVWLEMTGPGHLNIYTGNSINIRAEQDINLHADRNINMNAGGQILMNAGKNWQAQSQTVNLDSSVSTTIAGGSKLNLGSPGSVSIVGGGVTNISGGSGVNVVGSRIKLNEGISGSASFRRPTTLKFNALSDTGKQGDKWISVNNALQTIVPIAPAHEPWSLHNTTAPSGTITTTAPTPVTASSADTAPLNPVTQGDPPGKAVPVVECTGAKKGAELDPGPKDAAKQGVTNPVNRSFMTRADAPVVTEGIATLTPEQTKALIVQTGWSESGCKYTVTNQLNYCGKYQMGAAALVEIGYVKLDAFRLYGSNNKANNYPSSWTGKDGINSKEDFLNNGPVQEKAIIALFKLSYRRLLGNGGIKPGDDQCTIAGMLSVAHLLGAGGAKKWRMTAGGADANGMTGSKYFNRGRYAVDVLAVAPKK